MTDRSRSPDPGPPGAPRWLKVSAIVVAALAVVAIVLALTGVLGGQHGPGRHRPGGQPRPAGVAGEPARHAPLGHAP